MIEEQVLEAARAIAPQLIEFRRDLHRHPEIGLKEERTSEQVAQALEALGLEVQRNFFATGVVGLLRGSQPGKTILIRADMDALPVQELNDSPYRSQCDGVMHACGHDAHTAWLLGAATILAGMKETLKGNVKFMFQPAEECPGGANEMIQEGILENPKVDFAMGAHVTPDLPTGRYLIDPGAVTANPDFFKVTLLGRDAHGSSPHQSVDAINMGVQVYNLLQSFVSRLSDPCDEVVLSVCMFNSGTARGAIPGRCELQGTVRSFRPEVRQQARDFIEGAARSVTGLYGGEYDFYYEAKSFPVMNDPDLTARVRKHTQRLLGENAPAPAGKKFMGGEDYCFIARAAPSVFLFAGCRNDGQFEAAPLHNPRFQLDEEIIPATAALLAYNALQILNEA